MLCVLILLVAAHLLAPGLDLVMQRGHLGTQEAHLLPPLRLHIVRGRMNGEQLNSGTVLDMWLARFQGLPWVEAMGGVGDQKQLVRFGELRAV